MEGINFTPEDLELLQKNRTFKIRICWNCRKKFIKKLLFCSGCETAYYCDVDCQKADWSRHKSICDQYKGKRKLTQEIDKYAKTITATDIPGSPCFGYIIQIKDTKRFLEMVKQEDFTTTHLKNCCYTSNEEVYVSFSYPDSETFMDNYAFILYLMDMQEDLKIMNEIFVENRLKEKIPVLVYGHDIRHYTLVDVDAKISKIN